MKHMLRATGFLCVALLSLLGLTPFNPPVLGAGATAVSVTAPAGVNPGAQFTVEIVVAPGPAIAGAQFDLTFNPVVVAVSNVAEGNLFSQGGASTYFSSGTIDNTGGTVSGVVGVITSPGQSVSAAGTFAIITLTARTGGISP